ncbi:hypothetical protein SAMN02745163_02047, partial [Clostridium cavendishii DSM 21758]
NIEQMVSSPTFGLVEIKTEVFNIEQMVSSPTFGLAEIKNEVSAIEQAVGAKSGTQSSGPFFASDKYVSAKALNNTSNTVGPITVTVYNLGVCPKTSTILGTPVTATFSIAPFCATDVFFHKIGNTKVNISGAEIEVQFTGVPAGVLLYSRTTSSGQEDAMDVFNSCCFV